MSEFLPPPPANQPWADAGPYGRTSMPPPAMRSLTGLATAATILLAIVALVDIAAAYARFNRASLLDDVLDNPLSVELQDLLDADDLVAGTGGFHAVGGLALIVIVIIWQWRHAKNAQVLGVRNGLGPGWAIGGWFIPIANFVLPGMQMFGSSKGSDIEARQTGRPPKGAGIVIAWAIAFAVGAIMLGTAGALVNSDDEGNLTFDSAEDVEDAASSDRTAAGGYAVLVVAAVLGIVMVRTLTQKQTAAYNQMVTASPPQASPPPPGAGSDPFGITLPPTTPPPGAPPAPPPPSAPPPPPGAPPAPPPPPGDFPAPS